MRRFLMSALCSFVFVPIALADEVTVTSPSGDPTSEQQCCSKYKLNWGDAKNPGSYTLPAGWTVDMWFAQALDQCCNKIDGKVVPGKNGTWTAFVEGVPAGTWRIRVWAIAKDKCGMTHMSNIVISNNKTVP